MFVLGNLIGLLVGIICTTIIAMGNISEIEEEKYNAELRAVTHFRKLQKIENTIKREETIKTPAVYIIDKIKEVITSDQTNK